ncbi:hypothetical protein IMI45_20200 (plasmid) [Parageobacillus thermoglucosidasius]|uniref:Uncharacterized protein n=2 Tax=Parageobacillus thermoglucosidasius TaxID=1426 RepID=A0AB38R5Z2_PARTM|nr:hypothetical protein IMI45_20200 [Parageobacillus thermoglucosidasius]
MRTTKIMGNKIAIVFLGGEFFMNIQMELFPSQKQIEEQRKLLQTLIELKADQIRESEFKNFFGTVEEVRDKQIEVNIKIKNFEQRVYQSFPWVF